jgi:hypothetical protein
MSRVVVVLVLLIIGVSFSANAQAQDQESTKPRTVARPNIPGSFIIDFGLNGSFIAPTDWEYGVWGSRTANFYYQYPLRFGRSKFSFNPGIGVSLERWKFDNKYVLRDLPESPLVDPIEAYTLVPGVPTYYPEIKKVMLITNYVDVPLEFRFDTKPEDMARSFNFALGGRIGYLFDSQQKVKYKENSQWKKDKDKQDWGLSMLRYGVYTRIGIGAFNIFGFYNLSPMFRPNMGPDNTKMNTFTAGISLNGF